MITVFEEVTFTSILVTNLSNYINLKKKRLDANLCLYSKQNRENLVRKK